LVQTLQETMTRVCEQIAAPTMPAASAAQEGGADMGHPTIVVKNTFIEMVQHPPSTCRRCRSLPTSPRGVPNSSGLFSCKDDGDSTDAEATTNLSDGETTPSSQSGIVAAPTRAFGGEAALCHGPPEPWPSEGSLLNPRAKAWRPAHGVQRCLTGHFHEAAAKIAAMVKDALVESPLIASTEAFGDVRGWTVTIRISARQMGAYEPILTCAKHLLLDSAAAFMGVQIIGHESRPFKASPGGFSALLGAGVKGDPQACWDAFSKGSCLRGRSCKWRHPEMVMHIRIIVQVIEPLAVSVSTRKLTWGVP